MKLHTLHIGINDYRGTGSDLRGCVNDAHDLRELFAGEATSQTLLLDREATRERILRAVGGLLKKLKLGDLGVISFSGHGTYVADKSGDEPDGRDEALVCADLQLIADDEFRGLVGLRPLGSRVLFIADSCHSGTVHRLYQGDGAAPQQRVRFLPAAHLAEAKGGRIKRAPLRRGAPKAVKLTLANVIHFAGCRDYEFSFDAEFHGRPNGAFTRYLLMAQHLVAVKTFGDWFQAVAGFLPSTAFPQTPQCHASKTSLAWTLPWK